MTMLEKYIEKKDSCFCSRGSVVKSMKPAINISSYFHFSSSSI